MRDLIHGHGRHVRIRSPLRDMIGELALTILFAIMFVVSIFRELWDDPR